MIYKNETQDYTIRCTLCGDEDTITLNREVKNPVSAFEKIGWFVSDDHENSFCPDCLEKIKSSSLVSTNVADGECGWGDAWYDDEEEDELGCYTIPTFWKWMMGLNVALIAITAFKLLRGKSSSDK